MHHGAYYLRRFSVPRVLIADARLFDAFAAILGWLTHLASISCWYQSDARRDEFWVSQAALLWISKVINKSAHLCIVSAGSLTICRKRAKRHIFEKLVALRRRREKTNQWVKCRSWSPNTYQITWLSLRKWQHSGIVAIATVATKRNPQTKKGFAFFIGEHQKHSFQISPRISSRALATEWSPSSSLLLLLFLCWFHQ